MMLTETRQSRTSLSYYEQKYRHSRRRRRRHHTLDYSTLDKFNFVCIPLHADEASIDHFTRQMLNFYCESVFFYFTLKNKLLLFMIVKGKIKERT